MKACISTNITKRSRPLINPQTREKVGGLWCSEVIKADRVFNIVADGDEDEDEDDDDGDDDDDNEDDDKIVVEDNVDNGDDERCCCLYMSCDLLVQVHVCVCVCVCLL